MSEDKYQVELDQKFVDNFYGLVDLPAPYDINLNDLQKVLDQVKTKFSNMALNSVHMPIASEKSNFANSSDYSKNAEGKDDIVRPKTVLVVDDLGIITYQLEILFKRIGYQVVVSNEINDAIEKYKTQDFGYTVMDLFIPTEREGFILLDEIKKLSLLCKLNTKIIVMTASSKPEYKSNCTNRGADVFIEKAPGWQKELMDSCAQ